MKTISIFVLFFVLIKTYHAQSNNTKYLEITKNIITNDDVSENKFLFGADNFEMKLESRLITFLKNIINVKVNPSEWISSLIDVVTVGNQVETDEARHRRHQRHSMPIMMMFGVLAVGMVLVPMGFQFLAVLGGKALLLAKMALLLTAIQGLKKIATSPYNYGLYQAPTYPWNSDRKWLDDGETSVVQHDNAFDGQSSGTSTGLLSFSS